MFSRSVCAVVFTLSLVASTFPARAADAVPTASEIEAKVRAAAGPAIPSYREVVDSTGGGVARHAVTIRSGRDYREEIDEGPLHTAHGSIGGQAWRQNENGETILMQRDPGLAVPDAMTESVTPIDSPVKGYLVSSLDVRGEGVKRYVDGALWHVVRFESVRLSQTTVTTYDDFRTVAGHTLAFHVASSDGHPENDVDSHVTELQPEAIDRNALAVPKSRRILVEFPVGKTTVQLPVRLDRGKFFVRINIGSRGLDFILDSGSAGIFLEEGIIRQLGLPVIVIGSNGTAAGRFRQSTAIVPSMSVGDLTMHDVVVRSVPSVGDRGLFGDYRAVGLLGFDFIDGVVLKLDYLHGTAIAFDPSAFKPAADANGFNTDLRLGTGMPLVTMTINGAVGERFLLDTGGGGSLLVFDYFIRRNGAAMVDEGGGGSTPPVNFLGVGGAFSAKAFQLKEVVLGTARFHDYIAYVVQSRGAYDEDVDGAVGPPFLKLFDVYFDYAHARAYFVSNAS
jgi:hypothetical protein